MWCVCVCVCAQLCPTLCGLMNCSSSVHKILQTRTLAWVAMSSSRGSFRPRDQTCVFCIPCIGRWILYHCVTWEAQIGMPLLLFGRSVVSLFATPWTAARQDSLPITISWSFLKLMSIELVMPTNHLIFCHPLLPLPSIFPSIRVFSNELAVCIWWPKDWNFSISPSSEYSGLISFSIYWFNLLAIQGTVKGLLQYHNSNIISLVLSLLYGLTVISIHDYWKNRNFAAAAAAKSLQVC